MKQSAKISPPPPQLKLLQHILCANYQARIWHLAHIANPILASATEHGWRNEEGWLCLVRTLLKLAPDAAIELINGKCAKSKYQNSMCSCRRAGLVCTVICQCGLDVGDCDNVGCIAVLVVEKEEDIRVYITFSMTLVLIQDKIKETSLYVFLQ